MLRVLYCAADNRYDEAFVSAYSLAINSKEPVYFTLLTMPALDISLSYRPFGKSNAKVIEKELRKLNPENRFEAIDASKEYGQLFEAPVREWAGRSPYPLLRHLLPAFIKEREGRALILDTDVVALNDVSSLNDIDMEDKPLAAYSYKNKKGFDTGVILVDLAKIGELEDIKPEIQKNAKTYNDRKYFSETFGKLTAPLPRDWCERGVPTEKTVLKHFSRNGRPRKKTFFPLRATDIEEILQTIDLEGIKKVYEPIATYKKEAERKVKEEREKNKKDYILEISHLYKSYGDVKAVDDVSFKVKRGSLFAFLGQNGAGKSTTINIISSILEKDYGTIIVDGMDLDKERTAIKEEIGIVFQNSTLDDVLTTYENLSTRAEFYAISGEKKKERIKEISEMLDLEPLMDRQVKNLSGGQRRRLDIARSMLHEPKLLILDEPTTGLDPKTRQDVWHLIDSIREKTGMTVFLTTHYLEEAERATEIVIMDKGRIIAQGSANELKNLYASDYVLAYNEVTPELDALMKKHKGAVYLPDAGAYRFPIKDSEEARDFLVKHQDLVKDFEIKKGTMDDVFLNVTGIDIRKQNEEEGK